MDATVKEIALTMGLDEGTVRSVISLSELKVRGDGPKPKKGATPKLYRLEDVRKVWDYLKTFEQAP